MSDAVAAIGATITIDTVPIEEVGAISGLEISVDEVDVTSHDSPDFGEEVLPTIRRWGALSFPVNLTPTAVGQQALIDAADDPHTSHTFVITYTSGISATFTGFVRRFGLSADPSQINLADVEIRPESAPTFDWGS